MSRTLNRNLTIFLVVVIATAGFLIALKIFNNSYALPNLETPVIDEVVKTSDNPLQVKVKYTLTNMDDNYTVELINNTDAQSYKEDVTKNNGSNEYYVNGLAKGKTYEFTVKVCSNDTNCVTSASKSIEIVDDQNNNQNNQNNNQNNQNNNQNTNNVVTVGKISNLVTTRITTNIISLKWNAASNATGYKLKYKRSSDSKWYQHNVSSTSVNIKSLKPNTKYNISVLGIRNGISDNNNNWVNKTVITNPDVPKVKSFKVNVLSHNSASLTWKKSSNKNVSYQIYRKPSGNKWSKIKTVGYNTTKYTDKSLAANKKYYYKIRAVDRNSQKGKSFYSGYTANIKIKTPVKNKKTYIHISISKQRLYFYKNGRLVLKSNVVTGNKGSHHTPKGTYKIRGKARSVYLVGRDYVSFVNYWMLIDSGSQIGLHDATWRSKFGGTIYKGNGSHGCINLPLKTAKQLYKKAPVGTKVIVR